MSTRAAVVIAVVGGLVVYLAARRVDPHEPLDLVFPIVWVIGVVLVAIGHHEATS